MDEEFRYDVFVSHSAKDTATAREIAERLRADGLRVYLADFEGAGSKTAAEDVDRSLQHSRVLLLCLSKDAFGPEWPRLEAGTFVFRDPLNRSRRLIPVRLDRAPIPSWSTQFLYVDWLADDREGEYAKLLEACRPSTALRNDGPVTPSLPEIHLTAGVIVSHALSRSGDRLLTASSNHTVKLWNMASRELLRTLKGHSDDVWSVAWCTDQRRALSGADDSVVRVWDTETGRCIHVLEGHTGGINSVAANADGRRALSGADDRTVRVWDLNTLQCVRILEGHRGIVWSVTWSPDGTRAASGSQDGTVRVWDVKTGQCLHVLTGHTDRVKTISFTNDGRQLLSGSSDKTLRLWDASTGRTLRILEGHTGAVRAVACNVNGKHALSCAADDRAVRLWDFEKGHCICALDSEGRDWSVSWGPDPSIAFSGGVNVIRAWDLTTYVTPGSLGLRPSPPADTDLLQYTNAKVLLVGESGAGKTGLSKRLALDEWKPSDSTVGAWATQWKLPVSAATDRVEREIWLWDFGGQADQRLIHQLYMDETAMAVLVFDGQREDLFETLGQWDRDLSRASRREFSKLLVAGRVDAGGLRVSRSQVEAFAKERGYAGFLETSAKANLQCEELKQAIVDGIRWQNIPWRSTPLLFKRLKDEIVRLKDEDRVLMRFNELRATLQLRLTGEALAFTDEELKTVLTLLSGPGVVWELAFGSWVLLQPERINAYAQAVIQTMRADEDERGCLLEERVLKGDLTYHSSMSRLEADEERFVLLAMHQTLVERGLCLREHTEQGPLLVFPSYYRRERPELVGHPAVLISYRFNGFLDDIYATLVVRLHYTRPFRQDHLWRYAADFRTLLDKQLGVKLTRRAEGAGELEVYFEPTIPLEEKILFGRYVHEHLLRSATEVVRLRHYICPHCGTPVGNREVAMKRLAAWLSEGGESATAAGPRAKGGVGAPRPTIVCSECEQRVPLWDDMEQHFASDETRQRVQALEEQSAIVLDNESKERALVGEVISTVALAGQICREFNVSDHGIDMEVEFKSDAGEASGRKFYLQLKSGDSYLRRRKRDGAEVFRIPDERHARFWMAQEFPVLLVIRDSAGNIRWMEVRDWLRETTGGGKKVAREIIFTGERFDVMSVRRWRDEALRPRPG